MNFERGKDVKDALHLGREEFRMMGVIDKEAKRLGLIRVEQCSLLDPDPEFYDIAQWGDPKDKNKGIMFFQFIGTDESEKIAYGHHPRDYHIIFCRTEPGSIIENQVDYDKGLQILREVSNIDRGIDLAGTR